MNVLTRERSVGTSSGTARKIHVWWLIVYPDFPLSRPCLLLTHSFYACCVLICSFSNLDIFANKHARKAYRAQKKKEIMQFFKKREKKNKYEKRTFTVDKNWPFTDYELVIYVCNYNLIWNGRIHWLPQCTFFYLSFWVQF